MTLKFKAIINELKLTPRLPSYLCAKILPKTTIKQRSKIVYICEGENWSIDWDARYIVEGVKNFGLDADLSSSPRFLVNRIIHFGSTWSFVHRIKQRLELHNNLVATVFHGKFGLEPELDHALNIIIQHSSSLKKIVVSNTVMKDRMIKWGIKENKVVLIPLGVDVNLFQSKTKQQKSHLRKMLNIPEGVLCIGSFQKDGVGWGEGLKPKLIKGPDIFVDVCKSLASKYPIHCLLTGPSRGYVKEKLKSFGIPFTHSYVPRYEDIPSYYNVLDLYLVTSREEGGPKAILECMATNTPFVTTKVGMVDDIVIHGKNGLVAEVDDVTMLVQQCTRIFEDNENRVQMVTNGAITALNFDWDKKIAPQYRDLYKSIS